MTLANMTQQETDAYNRDHCKAIANELDLIAYGQAYTCPYCRDIVDVEQYRDNDELYDAITDGDECECPLCGETVEFTQASMFDWLEDALDLTYTINRDFTYRGSSVLVAFGGPNIYVDTCSGDVELYWWGDKARYPMSRNAIEALDDCLEEYYEMSRY